MGGRGASFLKDIPLDSDKSSANFELYDDDAPIPYEEMTSEMKKLNNKNIVTYKSMNMLPPEILNEQITAINNRVAKSKNLINIVGKENPVAVRLGKFSNKTTKACWSMNSDFTNLKIVFSDSWKKETPSSVDKMVKRAQQDKWWVDCDSDKTLRLVATHEYGHFIQYNLIKKIIDRRHKTEYTELLNNYKQHSVKKNFKSVQNLFDKIAYQINNKIALISKEKYGTMNVDDVGKYGKTNQAEWFAEVYANMALSSKPTDMAKAMKIYLRDDKK